MLNNRSTYKVIRELLFGWVNKELLVFLFFLVLSSVFWLILTLNQTFEKELPVGMRLTGVPENVVITTDLSDTIYVTVRDKGFMLMPYFTSNRLRPLSINFAAYSSKQKGHGQVPVADLRKLVSKQLLASAEITSLKADNTDFYYNYGRKKEVKVALQGNVEPGKNYYLAHVHFSPEKVTVYASDKMLDSLSAVQTEYLNISNFTDTLVRTVKLKPVKGMKFIPHEVKMTLYPDILTEESVEVPITTVGNPDNVMVRTFPQRVKVNFTVGANMYRTLNLSEFKVIVDYNEIADHKTDKCTVHLTAKPRGVSKARLEIEEVDYVIEQ